MPPVTATEARTLLPALLDRVAAGEEVTITRHGRPVAVLVRPDTLRARRAERAFVVAGHVLDMVNAPDEVPLRDIPGLSADFAEALRREVRAGRDGQR